MGFADMLSGSELSSKQSEQVSMIRTSGVALSKLINDILDHSKIEAGKVEIEHSPYALHKSIEEVTALLEPDARENGLNPATKIATDVPVIVNGDETRLRQIPTNLIGNAIKFTKDGGVTIEISCNKSPPDNDGLCNIRLFFSITDTGIGIPADKISQLFLPFSQADTSMKRRRNGTGLGLAICKRLCELIGGTISVESSEGSGSVFRLPSRRTTKKATPRLL
jgi:signal transduction histidine kinase